MDSFENSTKSSLSDMAVLFTCTYRRKLLSLHTSRQKNSTQRRFFRVTEMVNRSQRFVHSSQHSVDRVLQEAKAVILFSGQLATRNDVEHLIKKRARYRTG